MTEEVLAADCVGKAFGDRRVLTAATVAAHAGRVTALFGRNGEGKSTLLRIAAGVMAADYGTVRLRGVHVRRPTLPWLARRGVFFLPADGLLSRRIPLGAQVEAVARRFRRGDAADVVGRLRLGGLLAARGDALSGGERRRAEVALAVLRAPACLLADEPFQGVAPLDAEMVGRELRALADAGCAVLATGHETATLLALADQVVWMTSGTTYALGAPADAVRHDHFRREYLGPGWAGAAGRIPRLAPR